MSERLQKILARAGVASRRHAEELIRAGRVNLNGQVAILGNRATEGDDVRLDGCPLQLIPAAHTTLALYKPRGVVTSASDELGRAGVLDKLPPRAGLHPIGRLDRDSEGLLLLTTDGELTLRLTHPRYGHEKEYRAWTGEQVTEDQLRRLENGVELEDGLTSPARVRRAEGGLFITLGEGRNRQIRRMLGALGLSVTRLVRVRFGGLFLGDLEPGEYLTLGEGDLARLEDKALVDLEAWQAQERETLERWG